MILMQFQREPSLELHPVRLAICAVLFLFIDLQMTIQLGFPDVPKVRTYPPFMFSVRQTKLKTWERLAFLCLLYWG